VLPLAVGAAALAWLAPSRGLADRSELLLAALVALTALGIAPRDLLALRARWRRVLALSTLPFVALAPAAWALSRLFDGPVRDGVLALGLAPTEVAAAGLVALAVGDAALALAAVAGSLVVSAVAGPLAVSAVGGADVAGLALLGTFALVVLVPLAAGLAVRAAVPRVEIASEDIAGMAALVLASLLYAALSATSHDGLGEAFLGAGGFIAVSGGLALLWPARGDAADLTASALAVGMRDFAVAAALAEQAFGARAASVPGVYGVLILLGGSALAARAHRARPEDSSGRTG
jgi:predicted Na+-dependent transporter